MAGYTELEHFFRDILKVRNTNHRDYLNDLRLIKERGAQDEVSLVITKDIYLRLKREFQHDQSHQFLR